MDILQILANIAQLLSLIWLIFFGSKTIIDLIVFTRKKLKGLKPSLSTLPVNLVIVINLLLVLVVLALSATLLSVQHTLSPSPTSLSLRATPSPNITASPTPNVTISPSAGTASPASNYVYILTSPPPPFPIPCNINCVSKLAVVLTNASSGDNRGDLLLTFALTNKETSICTTGIEDLRLLDYHGTDYKGQGQILSVSSLSPGQTLIASAIFPLQPSPSISYLFSLVLSCQSAKPMIRVLGKKLLLSM